MPTRCHNANKMPTRCHFASHMGRQEPLVYPRLISKRLQASHVYPGFSGVHKSHNGTQMECDLHGVMLKVGGGNAERWWAGFLGARQEVMLGGNAAGD